MFDEDIRIVVVVTSSKLQFYLRIIVFVGCLNFQTQKEVITIGKTSTSTHTVHNQYTHASAALKQRKLVIGNVFTTQKLDLHQSATNTLNFLSTAILDMDFLQSITETFSIDNTRSELHINDDIL